MICMNDVLLFDEFNEGLYETISSLKNTKCLIFDLDGTLVNTIDDLARTCDFLLKNDGIRPKWTIEDYTRFVGNGAKMLVKRIYEDSLTDEELNFRYELFKKKYNEIKLDNAYIYSGVKELCNSLKARGLKLAVCTNKPCLAAVDMVERLFGKNFFDVICGAQDGIPKKPDAAMANSILKKLCLEPSDCVWIGDSPVDIESAENLGCKCIAVTWGYTSFELLHLSFPALIVDKPEDILKIFTFNIDN